MTCEETRELLSAYLDGELTEAEASSVKNHVDACAACAREFAALRRTVDLCRRVGEVEVPEGFHAELMQRIQTAQARRGVLHALGISRWRPAYRTAAAVVAVLILSIGISGVVDRVQGSGAEKGLRAGQTAASRGGEQTRSGGAPGAAPSPIKSEVDMTESQVQAAKPAAVAPAEGAPGVAEEIAPRVRSALKVADSASIAVPPVPPVDGDQYGTVFDTIDRKLIKRADLLIEVAKDKVDETGRKAMALVETSGGFVQRSSTFTEEGKYRGMSLTLRVPEDRFTTILGELEGYGKVLSRNVGSEDVTEQFIDTQAQIKNKERQEQRLQEIMGRANTVGELMQVESELSRIRSEIDSLKGRLKYLQNATSYSTITMTIREARDGAAAGPITPGFLQEVWQAFMGTFKGLAITLAKAVPYAMLIGAGWLVYSRIAAGRGKSAA